MVQNAFANSPVDNNGGVGLHIELNPNAPLVDIADFTNVERYQFGQFQNNQAAGMFGPGTWWDIPGQGQLQLAIRERVFRYAIGAPVPDISSGQAEAPGNQMRLSVPSSDSVDNQAAVLMHEFGHNLGLSHGGHFAERGQERFNLKPNYHSIMNYLWTKPVEILPLPPDAPASVVQDHANMVAFQQARVLDYSRDKFDDVNEYLLDELFGMGGHLGHVVPFRWRFAGSFTLRGFAPESGSVDWNLDGTISSVPLENTDINYFPDFPLSEPGTDVLRGHDDWSNLWYPVSGHDNFVRYHVPTTSSAIPWNLADITGGDCNSNDIFDPYETWKGLARDDNQNQIPDECEEVIPPPGAPMTAPYPHDRRKNRYISFDPNKSSNDGRDIAFQVTLDALTLGSCSGNGAPCRADRGDEDCNACSVSGDACITSADCQPMGQSCDPTGESCVNDQAGSVGMVRWVGPESPLVNGVHLLVSEPFRRVSTAWPAVVHVGDCEIVPIAAYSVVAVDVDAELSSTSLAVETIGRPSGNSAWWADGVGPLEGHCEGDLRNPVCDPLLNDCPIGQSCGLVWSEPDGAANFDDVLAAIMLFASLPDTALPHTTWVDLHGDDSATMGSAQFDPPNYVANFADVQFFVFAFQGLPYPFLDPADCPDTGTWP
jgi:hypothetical protein